MKKSDGLDPTVAGLIGRVFPWGTRSDDSSDLSLVPNWPPDLFGVTAALLETSGAYHHIVAGRAPPNIDEGMVVSIDQASLREWDRLAAAWATTPSLLARSSEDGTRTLDVPLGIQELWEALLARGDHPVFVWGRDEPAPDWWKIAYALFVIADECCVDAGYLATTVAEPAPGAPTPTSMQTIRRPTWIARTLDASLQRTLTDGTNIESPNGGKGKLIEVETGAVTIAAMIDPDVLCVQPKARTPKMGCTMRTLSHNLAKLPPRGVVQAHWQRFPAEHIETTATDLNLLVVPLPFHIEPDWFETEKVEIQPYVEEDWGWFELKQKWIVVCPDEPDDVTTFGRYNTTRVITALLLECRRKNTRVDGIILPEYALSTESHEELVTVLASAEPFRGVEFLVAGSSLPSVKKEKWREHKRMSNTAVVTCFEKDGTDPERHVYTSRRDKHHRWRLDGAQIESYALGLSDQFDPNKFYWEEIDLPRRQVHTHVFRRTSIFATLICEDLARSDPCHELVRALGPNLIFALLMDGPQLQTRWPARYATALADDPGSSVLTVTSRALLARSNGTAVHPPSWVVALWKDDSGRTREIPCPPGTHAVVISLVGQTIRDRTLDGRRNSETCSWQFRYHRAVALRSPHHPAFAVILGEATNTPPCV